MRKLTLSAAVAALLLVPGIASAGVTGPAFYVDGELYRTVGTPSDFSDTGAPAHSYDTIYDIPGTNVAEAKPGDRDFNGGRWMVHAISFGGETPEEIEAAVAAAVVAAEAATPGSDHDNGVFDTAEEVEAALDLGLATDNGVVKTFECPVIHIPRGR